MAIFTRFLLIILLAGLLADCKSKKKSMTGEEEVEVEDFIDFFPSVKPPYQFSDTSLLKKEKDSLLINYNVFTQFIPDSILAPVFGKNTKPKLYAMGKVEDDYVYLFTKAVAGERRAAFILGFDKKDQFIAGMPLLQVDHLPTTQQSAGIDRSFALTKTIVRKNADGTVSEGKDMYELNGDAKDFRLIMTDALDDRVTELINPIDTFSRKHKNAGDYGSGKMTLLSFRDGRKSDRLSFFIHFEKNNGECTGELKGEAILKSATQAVYREPGELCVLQFNFTQSGVTVKEVEACGSRRGLRCSFDGTYPRKKEAKPKTAAKTKKK
jgi:hypothetical protein